MEHNIYEIAARTKYPVDGFLFVQRGLEYTVNKVHGELTEPPDDDDELAERHISGESLCIGLREFAIESYGLLARTVLRTWSIHNTEDFGHIVFAMVDAEMMRKTEDDSIEDFADVYDFSQAFGQPLDLSEVVVD